MKTQPKSQHTPTPWDVVHQPHSNIASGEKDVFRIMEGDKVIARIARSWDRRPTEDEAKFGVQPIEKRSAKEAAELAAFIIRAVNAHKELLDVVKYIHATLGELKFDSSVEEIKRMELDRIIAKAEGRS